MFHNLFWVMLAIGTLLAGLAAVRGIVADGEPMYSDGVLLYLVMRVRDGLPIYPDYTQAPFLQMPYWPAHVGVAGLLARAADLGTAGTLYLTRGLALAAACTATVCIVLMAELGGARRRAAIVGGGLFVTAYVVHPWAYVARGDLPGLGLVLAGVVVLLRSRGLTGAAAAGLLMAAGFSCKQTFVVGIAAMTLSLCWRRQWLRTFVLVGAWVSFVGSVAATMHLQSGGLFFENTVSNNVLPFRLQTIVGHLSAYVPLCLPLLALASFGWRGTLRSSERLGTLRLYAVLATATGLFTLARAGSYYNHLLEATALLAVFGGIGFDRCLAARERLAAATDRSRLAAATVAAAAVLGVSVIGYGGSLYVLSIWATDPPHSTALIEALREASGPVLTERDALSVVLAGKEPIGGDPLGAALLARTGRWDPASLNDLVRSRAFSIIAVNSPIGDRVAFDDFEWWPPGTRESIQENYRFDRRVDGRYLYVPAVP